MNDTLLSGPPVMDEDQAGPRATLAYADDMEREVAMAVQAARDAANPPKKKASPPPTAPPSTIDKEGSWTGDRTTVLPRIEMGDKAPELRRELRPRYEVVKRLGEGAAGEVIAAMDNDIGRMVALKKIKSSITSPAALARFVEEIRTVGRLEHPNIVPIHDVGIDDEGTYYFVMKYVQGETLESIIEKLAAGDRAYHDKYGLEHRVQIFRGLLEAIEFAHSQGIIHRDIKPANIMVGEHGEVMVMDWGIAKRTDKGGDDLEAVLDEAFGGDDGPEGKVFETQVGTLIGTPAYMAPEQAQGLPVDERSEVYSLSVLFHELLTLEHYLDGMEDLTSVLVGAVQKAPAVASMVRSPYQPSVGMDLSWYLKKGLAKDPAKRYQTIKEMIDRLDKRSEGIVPIQCHLTLTKRALGGLTRFVDRHPMLASMGVMGLMGGFVAGVVMAIS